MQSACQSVSGVEYGNVDGHRSIDRVSETGDPSKQSNGFLLIASALGQRAHLVVSGSICPGCSHPGALLQKDHLRMHLISDKVEYLHG